MPSRSESRSFDRSIERDAQLYYQSLNRTQPLPSKARKTRSCSSADEFNEYVSQNRSYSHDSRISQWHQEQQKHRHEHQQQQKRHQAQQHYSKQQQQQQQQQQSRQQQVVAHVHSPQEQVLLNAKYSPYLKFALL